MRYTRRVSSGSLVSDNLNYRIAILHAPDASVGLRNLLQAALGKYRLIVLMEPDAVNRRLALATRNVADTYLWPRQAWLQLLKELTIHGVTTFADRYVDDLEVITRELGLPGASEQPDAWDKLTQRRLLNSVGASSLFVAQVDSIGDLEDARVLGPVEGVLKPRRESTSRGIRFVSPSEPTSTCWTSIDGSQSYLYEEILGTEERISEPGVDSFVSVETISGTTSRVHLAIFDKLTLVDRCFETGDIFPSMLTVQTKQQILAVVDAALTGLGVRSRITHTEVRLTDRGPQVIEVNGRLGGYISEMLRLATGFNACRAALDLALGARSLLPSTPKLTGASGLLLVPLRGADEYQARACANFLRQRALVSSVGESTPVSPTFRSVAAYISAPSRRTVVAEMRLAVSSLAESHEWSSLIDQQWLERTQQLGT